MEHGYPAYGAGGLNGLLPVAEFDEAAIILSAIGARCGKCFFASGQWTSLANTRLIFPNQRLVDPKFLWYQLDDESRWPRSGAAQPFIRPADVDNHLIYCPPLDEQKRIVAILDEAFEGLARARANTEANLADAREVLSNAIDTLMTTAPGASLTKLGGVCSFENGDRGKNYPGRKAFVTSGVPFINAGHLTDGVIDWSEMNYIPEEHFARLSNGKVRRGDILFCLRGSLGKFGVVDSDEPGAIASSLVIVRPNQRLEPDYLSCYFRSQMCKDMISDFENGAAQPNLSAKSLAAFSILLPSLEVQQQIASRVRDVDGEVRRLLHEYSLQCAALNALRQSLLQKAFSGELT